MACRVVYFFQIYAFFNFVFPFACSFFLKEMTVSEIKRKSLNVSVDMISQKSNIFESLYLVKSFTNRETRSETIELEEPWCKNHIYILVQHSPKLKLTSLKIE